ncbi:MAG TPA: mycofactocin biosynthesis glycosyltransferase MftF [Mycobacteriales bacterium]|nr:mycofactocin biosynthesis glycosyltransferase MftF [Mycobacteriales bacterium]
MTGTGPAPLPVGAVIELDRGTVELAGDRLAGGIPRRVIRLSDRGRTAWAELRGGRVGSTASGVLARRLVDAGMAHPLPAPVASAGEVTVVVPVRDRARLLERCLAAVAGRHRVVVVDDGSLDPSAIADVADRHDATLARRDRAGGPAAARNAGLAYVDGDLVAFLDSDCMPAPDWVDRLAGHFADPLVAAVAPRVVTDRSESARYLDRCGLLDLGRRRAGVRPLGRPTYVPTAALLVRRTALQSLGEQPFDAALRYGEDVDLVWRLTAAGWRVRYDPSVEVRHAEPGTWPGRLARRYRYGSSAASLARRHPGRLTHLPLAPLPALAVAAVMARRPVVAAAAVAATGGSMRRTLQRANATELSACSATAASLAGQWAAAGRYVTQFGLPMLAAWVWRGGPDGRRARAAVAAALVVADPIAEWVRSRPDVNPARYVAGRVADDVAYGAGGYAGCLQTGTVAPLLPVWWRNGSERTGR